MRKIIFSVLALSVMALSFKHFEGLAIGSKLPKADLKLKDVSGQDVSMSEKFKSKGLLVMFSCNTCPFVVKNQMRTIAICDFAQKMDVGVVVLNSNEAQRNDADSYANMKRYADEQKYNWMYLEDKNSVIADAFGATRTPECFLFNSDQKLVYHGAIDDNTENEKAVTRQHLREAIKEMANNHPVSVPFTRSVGCTIKRAN